VSAPPKDWREVAVESGDAVLEGFLGGPEAAGLVVFAHGSGSSRFSARNISVARHLNDRGLATLLFDLLTADEQRVDDVTREHRFDIVLLTRRLGATGGASGRRGVLRRYRARSRVRRVRR